MDQRGGLSKVLMVRKLLGYRSSPKIVVLEVNIETLVQVRQIDRGGVSPAETDRFRPAPRTRGAVRGNRWKYGGQN